MTHAHVVVSQRMLQKTRLLAAPERAHRIRQIPYGVEENETYFRPELEGAMRVIYCARLDPVQKRCQDLAPIWKEYIRQGGTGELMILGTGKGEGFLRRELKDEIAEGKVKLRGHVSSAQVLKEMAQSDVLLNVSNFEGLPQVVLEATSLGLYPLLSDIESGHREIVDVLGVGKTCHVGDVARFGRELMELEKNLTLVRSQRGRVRCATLRHYNLADCGLKYLEVIKAVGLAAPVPLLIQQPVRTARQWLKRACLLTKYRRHYRGALG
jgi:glycosyltransferase involved in cell wall biosynthesis